MEKKKLLKNLIIIFNKCFNKKMKDSYSYKIYSLKRIKYIKLFILFYLILYIFLDYCFFTEKIISSQISESNNYDNFNNIKHKYINVPVLRPYIERVSILSHIYDKYSKINKMNKTNINICMSLNNIYVYSTLVSNESVLFN